MSKNAIPEPWKSFLKEIDETAKEPIELYCLGGFVITLLYGLERSTADIDVISVIPRYTASGLLEIAGKGSSLHRKHGVYLDVVGSNIVVQAEQNSTRQPVTVEVPETSQSVSECGNLNNSSFGNVLVTKQKRQVRGLP